MTNPALHALLTDLMIGYNNVPTMPHAADELPPFPNLPHHTQTSLQDLDAAAALFNTLYPRNHTTHTARDMFLDGDDEDQELVLATLRQDHPTYQWDALHAYLGIYFYNY